MARLTPETERFLRKAVAGLPFLKRSEAKDELRAHLEDAIQQRLAQGSERELAEREAVAALGSADVLNRELLRAHFGKKWLLHFLFHKLGWWIPELPHIRLRPKFSIWKSLSKFGRQYAQGRYDEIIPRLERELESRGPNDDIHHELGLAYNAIGDHERALTHLQAAVDWRKAHPTPRRSPGGQDVGLAGAYSNLAGVLATLGKDDEAEAAVDAGLAADGRVFLLNYQKAKCCVKRDDVDGTLRHLEASLNDNEDDVTKGGHGKTLLLILSTAVFNPLRKDPRFSALGQRAYGDLASVLDPLASDGEAEAALRASLVMDGKDFLANYQEAKHCLERDDLDRAFDHLEASLNKSATNGDLGKALLLILSFGVFDPLRQDPRFDHLLQRSYFWS